jgi:hypothetical protein
MIIDDERDDGYYDNYHTVTFIIAPPITYETSGTLLEFVSFPRKFFYP